MIHIFACLFVIYMIATNISKSIVLQQVMNPISAFYIYLNLRYVLCGQGSNNLGTSMTSPQIKGTSADNSDIHIWNNPENNNGSPKNKVDSLANSPDGIQKDSINGSLSQYNQDNTKGKNNRKINQFSNKKPDEKPDESLNKKTDENPNDSPNDKPNENSEESFTNSKIITPGVPNSNNNTSKDKNDEDTSNMEGKNFSARNYNCERMAYRDDETLQNHTIPVDINKSKTDQDVLSNNFEEMMRQLKKNIEENNKIFADLWKQKEAFEKEFGKPQKSSEEC